MVAGSVRSNVIVLQAGSAIAARSDPAPASPLLVTTQWPATWSSDGLWGGTAVGNGRPSQPASTSAGAMVVSRRRTFRWNSEGICIVLSGQNGARSPGETTRLVALPPNTHVANA